MAKIRLNTQALAGSLVDAQVAATAAIAYSKLALSGLIVNSDIAAAAAIDYSKLALSGLITTTDLNFTVATAAGDLWVDPEVPAGTVNGTNSVFTLATAPVGYRVLPFLNGVKLFRHTAATDNTDVDSFFMSSAATLLTVGAAPAADDKLEVAYAIS